MINLRSLLLFVTGNHSKFKHGKFLFPLHSAAFCKRAQTIYLIYKIVAMWISLAVCECICVSELIYVCGWICIGEKI